ncbi:MAG: hypothetical protein LIO60_04675 [Oscillospiraceae bacterium]|nr:hypothetical protein [Oscillospiraceae bacterium]
MGTKEKPDVQKCVENVDNFLDLAVAGFLFLPRLSVRRGQTDVVKRQILKNCGVDFVEKNDLTRRSSKALGREITKRNHLPQLTQFLKICQEFLQNFVHKTFNEI